MTNDQEYERSVLTVALIGIAVVATATVVIAGMLIGFSRSLHTGRMNYPNRR